MYTLPHISNRGRATYRYRQCSRAAYVVLLSRDDFCTEKIVTSSKGMQRQREKSPPSLRCAYVWRGGAPAGVMCITAASASVRVACDITHQYGELREKNVIAHIIAGVA